jgi:L-threonylcarbamoyladenylate synthase
MKTIVLNDQTWDSAVSSAQEALYNDGIVVFPSDTVYGLAVNALSERAVGKLLLFKERPRGKAVSIALNSTADVEKYARLNKKTKELITTLLPGPFTVVLPSKHHTDKRLEAEDGTLGVRVAESLFMHNLLKTLPFPITATSANISGRGPHYSTQALLNTLSQKKKNLIDVIIDAGELPHRLPSTVINLSGTTLRVLRSGELKPHYIETVHTNNEQETKQYASRFIAQRIKRFAGTPLVIILKGDLGAGKTIFTKGVGEYLGIDNIVSPTFVLYYEYDSAHPHYHKLHHFDLYRTAHKEDLEVLDIKKLVAPGNVLIFEWGEKIGSLKTFTDKHKAHVIFINFTEKTDQKRSLAVYALT